MRLPQFRRRERVLAVLTLAAVAAGIAYVAIVEPLATGWLELHRKAEACVDEWTKLRALVGNRERIAAAYTRVEESVMTGAGADDAQLRLYNEVSRLTGEAGLEVDGLKPVRVAEAQGFDRYGVELSGRCTAAILMDLLLVMQAPEHLLRIDKLTVVVGRGKPPLTVTMRVSKLARIERSK